MLEDLARMLFDGAPTAFHVAEKFQVDLKNIFADPSTTKERDFNQYVGNQSRSELPVQQFNPASGPALIASSSSSSSPSSSSSSSSSASSSAPAGIGFVGKVMNGITLTAQLLL